MERERGPGYEGSALRETRFAFDTLDRLVQADLPAGGAVRRTRWTHDRGLVTREDANGNRRSWRFDPFGNIVEATEAVGTSLALTTYYSYDGSDSLRTIAVGSEPSPLAFGDGIRCIAAPLVRLAATTATGGLSSHPVSHGAGAGTFHYQLWYRNAPAAFCDPAAAWNTSNALSITWP